MATIFKRQHPSGRVVWRVGICVKRKNMIATFETREEACEYLEQHEREFTEDPSKFYEWREQQYHNIKRNGGRRTISPYRGKK